MTIYARMVRVEVAIQENASLPHSLTMEGYTLVGQVAGYDVGWPQHWILTNQKMKEQFAPSTQQPRQSKKRIETLTQEPTEVPMTRMLKCLVKFIDKWQARLEEEEAKHEAEETVEASNTARGEASTS